MNNVAIVSLGSGGTMGHMSLTVSLAKALSENKQNIFIFSEHDYRYYSKIPKKVRFVKIPEQKHVETIGGKLHYKFEKEFDEKIKEFNIDSIIFSTFFDASIVIRARSNNIKTMLISYPFRDSHRIAFKTRRYFELFDKIITLNDLFNFDKIAKNEIIVSPIRNKTKKQGEINAIKKILITCGGGGRLSSNRFMNIVKQLINNLSKNQNIEFTIIRGKTRVKLGKNKNLNIIKWSKDFDKLIDKHDLVISEAGYFTIVDLISKNQPSILIPGARRIDNQELRAIEFEKRKIGKVFFPEEDVGRFIQIVKDLVQYPIKIRKMQKSFDKAEKYLFNNRSLIETVSEWLK